LASQNTFKNGSFVSGYYTVYLSQVFDNKFINSFISGGKYCPFYNSYCSGTELHDCVVSQSYGRGIFCYYADTLKIYGGKIGPFRSDCAYISSSQGPMFFDSEFRGYFNAPYLNTQETGINWRRAGVTGVTNKNNISHSAVSGNDEVYLMGVRGYFKSVTDTLPDGSSGRVGQLQLRSTVNDWRPLIHPAIRAGFIGGEEVTVTLPVKRSSTSGSAKLSMRASSINGLDDVLESSWMSGSTNTWENLSLTFTPITDGIIEIDLLYYTTSTSTTIKIGPVTVV
jgi:hypothetical protein